jgi:histidinol-phosphate phosphatase family protein
MSASVKTKNKIKIPLEINSSWTLFLDRDGVINHEKQNDYIRQVSEFIIYEGVTDAMSKFAELFGTIIIVTNQRGIGKGLMSHEDLNNIHSFMQLKIKEAGGRIDHIYYAPELLDDSLNRKPNTGMGIQAKKDFPSIDFSKSIMVGNNLTDMQFGKKLGMLTVYLETTHPLYEENEFIDLKYDSLSHFASMFTW